MYQKFRTAKKSCGLWIYYPFRYLKEVCGSTLGSATSKRCEVRLPVPYYLNEVGAVTRHLQVNSISRESVFN